MNCNNFFWLYLLTSKSLGSSKVTVRLDFVIKGWTVSLQTQRMALQVDPWFVAFKTNSAFSHCLHTHAWFSSWWEFTYWATSERQLIWLDRNEQKEQLAFSLWQPSPSPVNKRHLFLCPRLHTSITVVKMRALQGSHPPRGDVSCKKSDDALP